MAEVKANLAVETFRLTRDFAAFRAVNGIHLRVPRGVFYGFLGPNGAGKSTTIKMLTGLLAPTGGTIRILEYDLATQPMEVKRRIGIVPEGLALFDRLSGREYLTFVGRVHGLDRATVKQRREELLDLMELKGDADKLIVDYSTGMRKKVALAAALIHNPPMYFLDEPFEGIDAIVSRQIKTVLQTLVQRGATIFLTTHVLEIAERLCTHVGIIHKGALVADGAVAELRAGNQTGALEEMFVQLVGRQDSAMPDLAWLGGAAP